MLGVPGPGVLAQLSQEVDQHGISGDIDLMLQSLEHVVSPLGEIRDPWRRAAGMQSES